MREHDSDLAYRVKKVNEFYQSLIDDKHLDVPELRDYMKQACANFAASDVAKEDFNEILVNFKNVIDSLRSEYHAGIKDIAMGMEETLGRYLRGNEDHSKAENVVLDARTRNLERKMENDMNQTESQFKQREHLEGLRSFIRKFRRNAERASDRDRYLSLHLNDKS